MNEKDRLDKASRVTALLRNKGYLVNHQYYTSHKATAFFINSKPVCAVRDEYMATLPDHVIAAAIELCLHRWAQTDDKS